MTGLMALTPVRHSCLILNGNGKSSFQKFVLTYSKCAKESIYKLNAQDIEKLTIKKIDYPGITIDLDVMYEFWTPILAVTELRELQHSTVIISYESNIYRQVDKFWMDADAEQLTSKSPHVSWFHRFRTVLLEVLVPVVQNLSEDRERVKQQFVDSTHIISYLMSAYTPRVAIGSSYRTADGTPHPEQYPIPDLTLSQWADHLSHTRIHDLMNLDDDASKEEMFDISPEEMEEFELDVNLTDITLAENTSQNITDLLMECVTQNISDVLLQVDFAEDLQDIHDEVKVSGALSLESIPIRKIEPLATPFATAMTNFNIWGQIALMIQRVRRRKEHFVALAAAVAQATLQADEQLNELKLERDDLRRAEEHYNETLLVLQKKKEQDKAIRREINDLKSRPGVQNTAKQTCAFKKNSSGTSHQSSVNPFHHRSSSRQPTPIGKRPSGYFQLDSDSSEEPATSDDEGKTGNETTTNFNPDDSPPFKKTTSNFDSFSNNDSGNDPSIDESQDDPVKNESKNIDLKSN